MLMLRNKQLKKGITIEQSLLMKATYKYNTSSVKCEDIMAIT